MYTVEFPNLGGLSFVIDPVAFQIGRISIYWYGIIISLAFMLSVLLAMKNSKKIGIDSDAIIDMVLFAAPIAIICARLYYVIFSWSSYKDNLSEIFKIWHGGLAIYGGVIGAFLSVVLFTRYKKINTLKMFDLVAPYFILSQGIGRWGNFFNQEAFGINTSLPWGMTSERIKSFLVEKQLGGMNVDPNLPVHPTFLYESVWNLLVFAFLLFYRKKQKTKGEIFFLYMILYGMGRFFIEGLRTDSLYLGNFRISQVLAFIFVFVIAVIFYKRRKEYSISDSEKDLKPESEYKHVLEMLKEEQEAEEQQDGDPSEEINNE